MSKKPNQPDQIRIKAEAQLVGIPPAETPVHPAEELLHELQVHQIELEMQNENLRQAQVALKESRDRYVDLYEFAPIGYLTLAHNGMISGVNLAGAKLLGVERKKLLRRRFGSFVAPEQRDRWSRIFADMLQHTGAKSCELPLDNGEGRRLQVRLECLHRATDGALPVLHAALTDITHLREAEEAMREWQTFVEHAAWGMTIGDIESRTIRLANPAYADMHGYTVEELRNFNAGAMYAPESRARLAYYAECARRDGHYSFECVRVRKDGSTFSAVVDVSTIAGVDGKTTSMVSVQDITERKCAEELLRKSFEEIEDLYNHAPCGYHSLDRNGIICRINDTELAWLGYARNEVVGKMKWPDLLTPAGVQVFRETFPQLKKLGFVHDLEIEIIRKDGTVFIGLINATAIYDSCGNYVMSRSTVADITERKQMERQLRSLAAHLQIVREEEKTGIAREIHDDLGGTLTALKMEAYWLADELLANKETASLLEHTRLISQLTDDATNVMRRIITGLRPSILDDLGLPAALEWQAAQFHQRTGIECRVNCVGIECGENKLDRAQSINLFRIFQETLTNASRHSFASRVEVEFSFNDDEIMLSVSDNGRGMPENHAVAPNSFGLLGITERAEQLGGRIKFGSSPNGGLSVTVGLPSRRQQKREEA